MIDKFESAKAIRKQEGLRVLLRRGGRYVRNIFTYQLHRLSGSSYEEVCRKGVVNRPHYGYLTYHAGRLANLLDHDSVSILEFGVAGGNGLLNLETHVRRIENQLDIQFEIYGFDIGEGLPEPEDYRDLPYNYQPNFYKMDVETLQSALERSELVLGDVGETLADFTATHDPAPIGAAFVDLDYYSSTKDAFDIFDVPDSYILPRILLYFDDIQLGFAKQSIPHIGEMAAIREFNDRHSDEKIGEIQCPSDRLSNVRGESLYSYHRFNHGEYDTYVGNHDKQNPIA